MTFKTRTTIIWACTGQIDNEFQGDLARIRIEFLVIFILALCILKLQYKFHIKREFGRCARDLAAILGYERKRDK